MQETSRLEWIVPRISAQKAEQQMTLSIKVTGKGSVSDVMYRCSGKSSNDTNIFLGNLSLRGAIKYIYIFFMYIHCHTNYVRVYE